MITLAEPQQFNNLALATTLVIIRPLAKYFCGRVKGLHFSCTSFMNYANAKSLSGKKFKRRFGVEKKTFERILEAFKQEFPHRPKAGRPWDLAREEQILVTLEYWRE
ncbi:hypothetical protein Xen7305DRAFT_00053580, partial [Xenococcus sp. PCC 7305]